MPSVGKAMGVGISGASPSRSGACIDDKRGEFMSGYGNSAYALGDEASPEARGHDTISGHARSVLIALISIIFLATAASASATWLDNQCVNCHEAEQSPISLGHSFEEWRSSRHARAGVGCDKCHGGDPSVADREAAHEGVLAARESGSLVHVTRLAETCGSCHSTELKAYASTVHARQVAEREQGATCSTCHGSMATSYPSSAELSYRCAACHTKPIQAQVALVVLAGTKIQLYRTGRELDSAKAVDPEWYGEAQKRLRDLERRMVGISLEWHTFAMDDVLHDSNNVYKLAKLLTEELDLMMELQEKPPH
jgi:hypothetical protein